MSYYDDRHYHPPRDRYRSSYHGGMDVVPGRTSSDSLDYAPPPPDYGYSHGGYGYPPPSHRQSRQPQRSGSASEYYGDYGHDGYDDGYYYQRKPRHHRHHRRRMLFLPLPPRGNIY